MAAKAPRVNSQQRNLALDFANYSFQNAKDDLASIADSRYQSARLFYGGDHWQNAEAWIGPHPSPDDEEAARVWADLEENFVSHPAVEEVTNRHRDAIIGQEPFWSVTVRRSVKPDEELTEQEQNDIDEAEALLTEWWDAKDPLEVLQEAVEDLSLGGRAIIRLFIPEGNLEVDAEGETFVPVGPFAEQLDRIWPTFIPADEGVVARDPVTMNRFSVFIYQIDEAGGASKKFAELTYLDPTTGETIIKTMEESPTTVAAPADGEETGLTRLQLGRRLMMHEMRNRPLITEPVLANQKLLNKALTMRSINVDLGGFLERVILNGQLPGEWVTGEGGKKTWKGDKFEVGAGTTNQIVGVQTGVREDGSPVIADPRIQYRDPVDVTTFDKTENAAYKNVLTATRQLHVLISGDANASGEARKQARDDYTKSLKRTKTRLDAAGRWMLETALQAACTLAGKPTQFAKYRIVFDSQLDPGPLSADDRAAIVSEYQTNLRSQEGSMALLGIDDTKAEQLKIRAEQEAAAQITPQQKQAIERGDLSLKADKKAFETQQGGDPAPASA